MSKIKWKSKAETLAEESAVKAEKLKKEKHKGKDIKKLSQSEINELVIELAKEKGWI